MVDKLSIEPTQWYGKPLCIADDYFVRYTKGKILWHSVVTAAEVQSVSLPLKSWQKLLIRNRLFERILHIDVRWAVPLRGNDILFLLQNKVYRLNLKTGYHEVELTLGEGKPLSYLHITENKRFGESIVIGDYFANPERKEVKIYRRDMINARWEIAHVFPTGSVRHIHGMIQDVQKECVYILTGDEDAESGIWITEDDFSTVRPLVVGKQLYRSCQILVGSNSLLYLTDAPSEENYVCEICGDQISKRSRIKGTVIYGTTLKNRLFFSTTVEPDAHAVNRLEYWLTNKRGKGIHDKFVHICVLNQNGDVKEVMKAEHDGSSLRLCQYGVGNFCSDGESTVYFSMTAVKKEENHIFKIIIKTSDRMEPK